MIRLYPKRCRNDPARIAWYIEHQQERILRRYEDWGRWVTCLLPRQMKPSAPPPAEVATQPEPRRTPE